MGKKIYLEANNGGDYILMEQLNWQEERGIFYLEIGHCCVTIVRAHIPVELIPCMFEYFMMKEALDVKRIAEKVMKFNDKEVNKKLVEKVKPLGFEDDYKKK